jgi:hypothetical protein
MMKTKGKLLYTNNPDLSSISEKFFSFLDELAVGPFY